MLHSSQRLNVRSSDSIIQTAFPFRDRGLTHSIYSQEVFSHPSQVMHFPITESRIRVQDILLVPQVQSSIPKPISKSKVQDQKLTKMIQYALVCLAMTYILLGFCYILICNSTVQNSCPGLESASSYFGIYLLLVGLINTILCVKDFQSNNRRKPEKFEQYLKKFEIIALLLFTFLLTLTLSGTNGQCQKLKTLNFIVILANWSIIGVLLVLFLVYLRKKQLKQEISQN